MGDHNPLVSIIIPVFNGAAFLEAAIDSALTQDYDKLEIVVVNDGSTDDTDRIARGYGNRIRYFQKENGGVSTALNLALKHIKGEYISWLSHDDYYLPHKVFRQIGALHQAGWPKNALVTSGFRALKLPDEQINDSYLDSDDGLYSLDQSPCMVTSLLMLLTGRIHGCSLLIPRMAFSHLGNFDEELITTQDYHKWFTFIAHGFYFLPVNEVLFVSRKHPDQGSRTKAKIHNKERNALNSYVKHLFYGILQNEALTPQQRDFFAVRFGVRGIFYNHFLKHFWRVVPIKDWRKKLRGQYRKYGY